MNNIRLDGVDCLVNGKLILVHQKYFAASNGGLCGFGVEGLTELEKLSRPRIQK